MIMPAILTIGSYSLPTNPRKIDVLSGRVIPQFNDKTPTWLDINQLSGPYVYFDLGNKYLEGYTDRIAHPGANLIIRKEICEKCGGFQLPRRSQDTELCYRLRQLGARFAYSPELLVYHKTEKDRLNKNYVRRWYFVYGREKVGIFKKIYTGRRYFFRVPLWLYRKCLKSFFQSIWAIVTFNHASLNKEVDFWENLGSICGLWGVQTDFDYLR